MTDESPFFSIIIPVYNKETSLSNCLSQLEKMTFSCEIIFIDDGSTDNSSKLIQEWLNAHDSLHSLLLTQKNAGPGSARNKGINAANGKYIWFLDVDDFFNISALKHLHDLLEEKNNPDILNFCYKHIKRIPNPHDFDTLQDAVPLKAEEALLFEPINVWSHIFKTSFIKSNNIRFPDYYYSEDLVFTIHCYCAADNIYKTDTIVYLYYQNFSSLSLGFLNNHIDDFVKSLNYLYKYSKQYPKAEEELLYKIETESNWFLSHCKKDNTFLSIEKQIFSLHEKFNTRKTIYHRLDESISSRYTSSRAWKLVNLLQKLKHK